MCAAASPAAPAPAAAAIAVDLLQQLLLLLPGQ